MISLDMILTAHYVWLGAAATTFAITVISYAVFPRIVKEGRLVQWDVLAFLALGSALGAGLATYLLRTS